LILESKVEVTAGNQPKKKPGEYNTFVNFTKIRSHT